MMEVTSYILGLLKFKRGGDIMPPRSNNVEGDKMLEKIKQKILWISREIPRRIKGVWNKYVAWVCSGFNK